MLLPRKPALVLLIVAILAMVAEVSGAKLPTISWFFSFSPWFAEGLDEGFNPGWIMAPAVAIYSLVAVLFGPRRIHWNPLTERRLKRFRSLRRGYVSFLILMGLVFLAMLDQAVVGKRALAVQYEGRWHFPAFSQSIYTAEHFGLEGLSEVDYRVLQQVFRARDEGNRVILPIVPWDPVFDSDTSQRAPLVEGGDGLVRRAGRDSPYSGLAFKFYEAGPEVAVADMRPHTETRFRRGQMQGRMEGFSESGDRVLSRLYHGGEVVEEEIFDEEAAARWELARTTPLTVVLYPPVAPSWSDRHFLGTDSRGWDILAQLYGGFQVVLKAVLIYLGITYFCGVAIGSLMGYFGGTFDIIVQRFVEIMANIPFLYVVIILTSRLESDQSSLLLVVGIICLFSWIHPSYYMRTATYREKARDYTAAARVLGASTPRILFRHIMPNSVSTIVTLIPFSVATITTALTALDFIGFGLPGRYASWGRLLADGTANLYATWIVGSVFVGLVVVLTLVSFVGEAIREAYDPKQFTTYQ